MPFALIYSGTPWATISPPPKPIPAALLNPLTIENINVQASLWLHANTHSAGRKHGFAHGHVFYGAGYYNKGFGGDASGEGPFGVVERSFVAIRVVRIGEGEGVELGWFNGLGYVLEDLEVRYLLQPEREEGRAGGGGGVLAVNGWAEMEQEECEILSDVEAALRRRELRVRGRLR